jgi:serine/threonine protein kinase
MDVCRGLQAAHGDNVVHRDLSLGNVWLAEDGTAKIGDFGLAVSLDRTRLTQAGMMAYAERVAQNDPFQLRMTKLAVNQALDAQGFTGHIRGAHALYILSSTGEGDPAASVPERERTKRRPMVQRALDNQKLAEDRAGH